MEADFSIRNEMESIKPPSDDKFSDEMYAKYSGLKSKFPPFPSVPVDGVHSNRNRDYIDNSYLHQMLGEQQSFDRLITLKILDQQNSWKWCSFILLIILFLCFFKIKNI